jgi:hypothetical protein
VLYGSWRDQVVVGRPDDPSTVGLDGSGGPIWNHLMELGDVDTVVHRIADDFAIDLETARRDVTTFVDDLIERRLVSARR